VRCSHCSLKTRILLEQLLLLLLQRFLIFRLCNRFDLITSKECFNYNGGWLVSSASSFITYNYEKSIWLVSEEHLQFWENFLNDTDILLSLMDFEGRFFRGEYKVISTRYVAVKARQMSYKNFRWELWCNLVLLSFSDICFRNEFYLY